VRKPAREEGAVLFVVLMIIMAGTASAAFAAHTVATELRGSGFARQQMQTRYAAHAAVVGALEWFDIFGPEVVRDLMASPTNGVSYTCTNKTDPTYASCYPEIPLANNRRAYRLYPEHFQQLNVVGPSGARVIENLPVLKNSSFGTRTKLTPNVVVDLYDEQIVSTLSAGSAAQGGTKFKYMRTTMAARGRAGVGNDYVAANQQDPRNALNESASDMRAYVISGPFITGTQ
jgi:hypothetical protein